MQNIIFISRSVLMFLPFLYTIFSLIFVSLFVICWRVVRPGKHIYNVLRNQGIPCEPFVPFIGQLPRLYQYRKQDQIMKFHEELTKKYGLNFLFLLGPYPRLVVQEAELIGDILSRTYAQNYQKPTDLSSRLKPL